MADGEKRIKELEEITALTSNDYFVVDSSASGGETKKYKATNITDIIDNIPELVAEFEPNHYYDRDALVAHEGKVYYHNAPGASYEEFPTGYQFIQIDLTGLLSRLGFGISIQHNSSFTYNKGDYCMEDYILYRCLNDNVTGAWSSSDWERASLGYDLSSIYKPRLDEHDEQIEESLALGTASGEIATFTDGSTLPMRKLEVAIEPVQSGSGEPSPTNVRPISGWDECNVGVVGKNWIADTIINGQIGSNGGYTSASNRITNSPSTTPYVSNSLLKKGTYTLSTSGLDNCTVLTKDAENNIVDNYATSWHDLPFTFTITKDAYVLFTCRKSNNADISPSGYHPQIEVGEESSTYTPYNTDSHIYTIDLDETRYGGTLDVVSGVLTVDRGYVDLGTLYWSKDSQLRWFGLAYGGQIPNLKGVSNNDEIANIICSNYRSTSRNNITSGNGICINVQGSVLIADSYMLANYDETQFKTAMNGVQLVYELATPQTIQLTSTEVKSLLATNNVFTDTGDILDATYVRNANITINELIQRIENLENA